MPRRMANPAFRAQQWEARFAQHVAPLNLFVDSLDDGPSRPRPPYIAPMYGGIEARLLTILRDPGPATQELRDDGRTGSGFLCMENDDPTAERICGLFSAAGIPAQEIVPWNAYPWYFNRKPKASELEAGIAPLKQLLDLMANLRVVMLLGGEAQSSWRRLERRFPGLAANRGIVAVPTYHASPRAFVHKNAEVRAQRRRDQVDAFTRAAGIPGYTVAISREDGQALRVR